MGLVAVLVDMMKWVMMKVSLCVVLVRRIAP